MCGELKQSSVLTDLEYLIFYSFLNWCDIFFCTIVLCRYTEWPQSIPKHFMTSCVLKLCRVCSYREKVRSDKRDKRSSVYRCEKFRDEILTVFGLNISSDEEGKHPSLLCTR